jgi:hypothetical protein
MTQMLNCRDPQRGSAMLVTMIIIASLLAGAVVLVSMQLSSSKSTDLSRSTTAAMYCAEAGLHAARAQVGLAPTSDINSAVAAYVGSGTPEPTWLSTAIGVHDANGDGVGGDYHVYLRDNDDEEAFNGGSNAPTVDVDGKVWVVSVCDLYPETPQVVSELLDVAKDNATLYDWQQGGAFGNGNYNFMQVTQ